MFKSFVFSLFLCLGSFTIAQDASLTGFIVGFEDEERDLRIGAQILRTLGFKTIRLLTNNPKKITSMADMGILVTERLNLLTEPTKENNAYLLTKASKSGHMI